MFEVSWVVRVCTPEYLVSASLRSSLWQASESSVLLLYCCGAELQSSSSGLTEFIIYEVNKGCWKWAFLPHSLGDLRCKRQLGLGKSYFVNAVSDIFSLLAVVGNLFCRALILICLIFTRSLFSPLLYGCICPISQGTSLCLNKMAFTWEERRFFNSPYWHSTSFCATC